LELGRDIDLGIVGAGFQRSGRSDGANLFRRRRDRRFLFLEIGHDLAAGEPEEAFLGLADEGLRRDAHLPDDRAERVGDIGVRRYDAFIADDRRQAGIVERRGSAEPDHRPVERDRKADDPRPRLDRALHQGVPDGFGAVQPIRPTGA